jgi:hypothetical protein
MLDVRRYICEFSDVEIEKPIFFLGTHGSGLTLVSRMIRRNRSVVSVTGNYQYWSGADEMAVVLGGILPFELSGIKHKLPSHKLINNTSAWIYACDSLIDIYRLKAEDYDAQVRKRMLNIIRWLIYRNRISNSKARFTDKSQVYTVKASFINEILEDKNPHFILITRNPYVLAYRAPEKAAALKALPPTISRLDKMKIAAQHWKNSINAALEDSSDIERFICLQFEDIIKKPKKILRQICTFVDLEYSESMLPAEGHIIPFGSRYRDRWYPIKENINQKYLEEMNKHDADVIAEMCKKTAQKVGYNYPSDKL